MKEISPLQQQAVPHQSTEKKTWAAPDIEFISGATVQSGKGPSGTEGVKTPSGFAQYHS